MATASTTETPIVDPVTGRRRNASDEELRDRSARLQRTVSSLSEITDEADTDENWAEVFRGLEASRLQSPPQGGNPDRGQDHRPRFRDAPGSPARIHGSRMPLAALTGSSTSASQGRGGFLALQKIADFEVRRELLRVGIPGRDPTARCAAHRLDLCPNATPGDDLAPAWARPGGRAADGAGRLTGRRLHPRGKASVLTGLGDVMTIATGNPNISPVFRASTPSRGSRSSHQDGVPRPPRVPSSGHRRPRPGRAPLRRGLGGRRRARTHQVMRTGKKIFQFRQRVCGRSAALGAAR